MSSNNPRISITTGDNNSVIDKLDSPSNQHSLRKRHSPGSNFTSSSRREESVGTSNIAAFAKLRKISGSDSKAGIDGQQDGTGNEEAQRPSTSKTAARSTSGNGRRNSQLKYLTDYFPNQETSGEFRLTRSRSKAKQNLSTHEAAQQSYIPVTKEKNIKRHSPHAATSSDPHHSSAEYNKSAVLDNRQESVSGSSSSNMKNRHHESSYAQSNSSFTRSKFEIDPGIPLPFNLNPSSVITNMQSASIPNVPQQQRMINEQPNSVEIMTDALDAKPPLSAAYSHSVLDDTASIGQQTPSSSIDYYDSSGLASSSSLAHHGIPPAIGINRSTIPINNYGNASNTNANSNNNSKPSSSMFSLRSHQHVNRATTFLGSLVPRMQHLLSSGNNTIGNAAMSALGSGVGNGSSPVGGIHHSSSRIMSIVDGLRSSNEIRQSESASELAEMLLLGNEESLPNMPVRDIIQCLMVLLQKDHNFELMLTAARCITNMQEALPRALPLIADAIPLLLQKLKRIEYIDVAEQSLIALEVMSRRNARNILVAGGIASTISHVDFFSLPSQRLAFQIAANCAVYVMPTDFGFVKDCLGELTQRLNFVEDKRCIESICTFFNRLVENMRNHPERLREIVGANFDFLKVAQQLLMIQPSTLGSNTFLNLLKSLRYMCTRCGDIAVALINMEFGRTLRYLLVGHEKDVDLAIDISSRPSQQLKEIIELMGELVPNLPNTEVSEITALLDHYMNMGSAYSNNNIMRLQYPFDILAVNWYSMDATNLEWKLLAVEETTILENAKNSGEQLAILELEGIIYEVDFIRMIRRDTITGVEYNLDRRLTSVNNSSTSISAATIGEMDDRNILKSSNSKAFLELIELLCPILVEIGTTSTCVSLRFETLKVMVRMIYALESETQLRKVLANVPLAIYIASTLSSNKSIGVLVTSIQLVHILLEKIPHLYVPLLDAEGVFHEIEKVAKSYKKYEPQGDSLSLGKTRSSQRAAPSAVENASATTNLSTPSDLSLSSYLAAAAAVVNASAASNSAGSGAVGGSTLTPLSHATIVNHYTQQFSQQLQQQIQQRRQPPLPIASGGAQRSVAPSSAEAASSFGSAGGNNAVLLPNSAMSQLSHTLRQQQQQQQLQLPSGLQSTSRIQHHHHHQHVVEQLNRTHTGGAQSGNVAVAAAAAVSLLNQQHQFPVYRYAGGVLAPPVGTVQQQQQQQLQSQVAQAAAVAQNLLNNSPTGGGVTAASSLAPFLASVISASTVSGSTSSLITASDALIQRAHAAFPDILNGHLVPNSASSAGHSSQPLNASNAQQITPSSSINHHHSQSALKQSILDRLQKYIQAETTKLLAKYTGDRSAKYGIRSVANGILLQLTKIAKQLVVQGRDVGCEPLNALSRILLEAEISAFQLNHSGIISALNTYLTDVSDKMTPPHKLRLRRFAAIFMKMTHDNMKHCLPGSNQLLAFERLVHKVVLAIGQLEQFHVKITNLSGIVQSGAMGSSAILNTTTLSSTTYLRGAQALRFFQTHQIRCNLKRHPTCKHLKEWRHGRGSIKVDPFTSISAIERYLLDRGIGVSVGQTDDSSDNDDISDEEQDLSYSSSTSYNGRIELYIGDNRVPSDMSILQAIRQYSLPHEDDAQETIPANIWITAHTLYYKTATDGSDDGEDRAYDSAMHSYSDSSATHASTSTTRSVGSGGGGGATSGGTLPNANGVEPSPSSFGASGGRRYHHRHRSILDAQRQHKHSSSLSTISSSRYDANEASYNSSSTTTTSRKTSRVSHRATSTDSIASSLGFALKKEKYSASLTKDSRVFKDGKVPTRTAPHLKYLNGTLDEKIDDPSVDCLLLLKALYGLNTYWWALFDEQLPPPSHAAILPNHAFHSPKLNSKVSRQLSDFLSVATQQIPKWTSDIVKAVPFAFSFVTRRNLLYCTAFGRDRALMHLVNESAGDEHDGDSTSRLIPRLERKKVSINRNNLLKDAQQIFAQMGSSKAMLEVGFEGEVGTGFGPTLEFYSTLSREVQTSSLKMWSGKPNKNSDENSGVEHVVSENGLYPIIYRPNSSKQMEMRIKKFEFFGRLLAQSLMDSRMLDIPIAPTFFKWLIRKEEDLGMEDFEVLEPTIYKSIQQLSDLADEDFSVLETYFTYPNENAFELLKGGKNIQLSKSNLKQFIELVCYWRLVEGVRPEMEAIRRGFNLVINVDVLQIFFSHEIEELFCGCLENGDEKVWSKTALQQAIRPDHGFTHESIQIVWLVEMLLSFSNEKRRKFLQFVTGSPRLPIGGFRALNPALTVVRKTTSSGNSDHELPSAMTCYNYLKVPPYESYTTFVERFEVALQFIHSFHLT